MIHSSNNIMGRYFFVIAQRNRFCVHSDELFNIKIFSKSFERVEEFKYLGTIGNNPNESKLHS
jgi:hypothetical protein